VSGWLWLVLFVPPIVFLAVARNQGRLSALRSVTVDLSVDEFGVRRELADGRQEVVDWTELTEVEVLTARTGPHRAAGGVVILAGDDSRGCLVPIDRVHESGLVEGLQRLPGFDVRRFVEALTAKPPRRTSCWQKAS
jgi:hypothetical protein